MTPEKVALWQNRFLQDGIPALEKDAPRSGRIRTITDGWVKKVLDMTLQEKPSQRRTGVLGPWQRRPASVRPACDAFGAPTG